MQTKQVFWNTPILYFVRRKNISASADQDVLESPFFEKYINQYDTIFLNMQEFLSQTQNVEEMLVLIKKSVLWDLTDKYPDFRYFDDTNLMRTVQDIYSKTKRQFVVIIDEWDCIFREYKINKEAQEKYLDFLRGRIGNYWNQAGAF